MYLQVWFKSLIIILLAFNTASDNLVLEEINPIITNQPIEIDQVLHNPFMGMAPPAVNGPYSNPHRLVYTVITWRELEPIQGEYAFDELEENVKLDYWDQQGVKLIIRFVMDYSDDQGGMDIPDWLYEEIDEDGIWYDESVGKGFSPNYDNIKLINHHNHLITALGEQYNDDPRIAFIALGSLGHWGEWHTYMDQYIEIPFPELAVSDLYVEHYLHAFPNKHLLMRRPHPIAKTQGLGLYNDMFGSHAGTVESFIDWFEHGYISVLGNSEMPAMPGFWIHTPSGGEFANANQVRSYFTDEGIDAIIAQAKRSRTSWLGPSNPTGLDLSAEEQQNLDRFLNTIGYRFSVKSVSYRQYAVTGESHTLSFIMENNGVAPFYYRWPIEMALINGQEEVVVQSLMNEDIRRWLPGLTQTNQTITIPDDLKEGDYTLTVAILDEHKLEPGVDFAMESRRDDGRYTIGTIQVLANE